MGRSSSTKKTFRDGTYYRHVWVGKRTVKEGEACAVWDAAGARQVKEGPQRVKLWFSHVRFLDRHLASEHQYLVVQFRDGTKQHHRGPIAVFFDPCVHERIAVYEAYRLSANEAVVVYNESFRCHPAAVGAAVAAAPDQVAGKSKLTASRDATVDGRPPLLQTPSTAGVVERRIVHGPCVFTPTASEWVHTFSWHGSITDGKGSKTGTPGDEKKPHALKFEKLRCMPDQMYCSVRDVRTSDDAQLTVQLMLFYEMRSIERMLDATNDPIGDFVNAASADVMTFGASHTYERFMEQTSKLSEVGSFPILQGRMEQIGYRLSKVIYRGFSTNQQLQAMHDEAIAKRTKLRLMSDTAEVEQAQTAMELRCKQERSEQERQLAENEARHKLALLSLENEQKRRESDADHAQAMRHEQEKADAAMKRASAENGEDARRLEALKTLGVDLTKYLCCQNMPVPDRHLRIESSASPSVQFGLDRLFK